MTMNTELETASVGKINLFPRINKKVLKKYPMLGNPEIPDDELQEAADCCNFLLHLHSAILYGLIEGDADNIDQQQCIRVLEYAKSKGIILKKIV